MDQRTNRRITGRKRGTAISVVHKYFNQFVLVRGVAAIAIIDSCFFFPSSSSRLLHIAKIHNDRSFVCPEGAAICIGLELATTRCGRHVEEIGGQRRRALRGEAGFETRSLYLRKLTLTWPRFFTIYFWQTFNTHTNSVA